MELFYDDVHAQWMTKITTTPGTNKAPVDIPASPSLSPSQTPQTSYQSQTTRNGLQTHLIPS